MAAPSATTLYVGSDDDGNVAKSTNAGWTWPSAQMSNCGAGQVTSLEVKDSSVLVGGNTGTVRRSDDGGVTYSLVGNAITGGGNMYVAFDGDTVYAAVGDIEGETGTGQIYRSVDGGAWTTLTMTASGIDVLGVAKANELILADDGTLYMGDSSAVTPATTDAVWRSINPTAAEPTPGTTFEAVTGLTDGATTLALDVAAGSSNILAVLIDTEPDSDADTLKMYTDTLSAGTAGPELVAPADGYLASGVTGTVNVTFTVKFPTNVTTVTLSIANNPDFSNQNAASTIVAPAVSSVVDILGLGFSTEGRTIYWRARATVPFNGAFSDVRSFEMPIITRVQAPIPDYPAGDDVMNVPLTPLLNWSSFKAATGYQLQLSTNSDMSSPMIDETLGNITSYKIADPLAYDSTYYWRVRAVIGTAAAYSDWSAIIGFTTMSKPVAPAPPIVIEPTPAPAPAPAPITPAYIYAIIAIGAVLVIVVIVLIVRTRRVP
ncbi:hypothetical protein ES703_33389 [subsurface metagenome]